MKSLEKKQMEVFKEIDIAEPIWKTKSVGLAVDDVPLGQNVKVTISYKRKKDGELAYPGEYIIEADKIRTYPAEFVRGNIKVHIVPISDLAKLTIFNSKQKTESMLFNSDQLGKIIKESEDAKNGNFENKKLIEPGKHIMSLLGITLEHAKSDGNPMVVAEFQLDEEHRTIKEFFKLAGENTDIPREKLVKLFHRGFGYEIQPCKTEADLLNQLKKFAGKQLTVAVKGRKKAYAFQDKEGKDVVMEQTYPEYWYCGTTAEFEDFYIDMSKSIVELSPDDKQKLVAFAELNGGPYIPKSQQEKKETKTDALPPQEEKKETPTPQKVETVPAKGEVEKKEEVKVEPEAQPKVTQEAPAEEESADEFPEPEDVKQDDDDFPF
jgi:hypothetical protein